MAEPTYGIIWNQLKCGKVVPFLGAGASFVGRQGSAKWLKPEDEFIPSGQELANFLALEAEFPSNIPSDREDLSKVCPSRKRILLLRLERVRMGSH